MKNRAKLIVVSVGSMFVVACLGWDVSWRHPERPAGANAEHGSYLAAGVTKVSEASQGFGPLFEAVLPGPARDGSMMLLDLETGRWLRLAGDAQFRARPKGIMDWIHAKGLDISGQVWPGGGACVTYNMTVYPVAAKCWDEMTAEQLSGNRALEAHQPAPRRQLVLGHGRTDTYLIRTSEGNLGMLQLVGLSAEGQGVKIRYQLLRGVESQTRALSASGHVMHSEG